MAVDEQARTDAAQRVREIVQPGRALDTRRTADVTRADFEKFDDALVRLVQAAIMPPEATNADTYFLLLISARYGLDPFLREIWAAKMKGKTGDKGGVAILVGRDGLLSIAERHRSFRGFRNQAVYENDDFTYDSEPRKMPDGSFTHVRHSFDVTKDRGTLLGAWAEVYRQGRPPVFFWAPLMDYLPTSERKLEYSPWKSMRNVMIEKCALSTALRIGFRITGIYVEDEMWSALQPSVEHPQVVEASNWPEDEALASWLGLLFDAAEEAAPGSWLPGKRHAALDACESGEDYVALADRLEEFIQERGGKVPEQPEPVSFEEPEAEPVPEPEAGEQPPPEDVVDGDIEPEQERLV